MRFVDKVFLCVLGVSLAATAMVFALDHRRSAQAERQWFFARYDSLGRQLGMTFTEVERATDHTVLAAANYFRTYVAEHGVPDRATMDDMSRITHVNSLGTFDADGISGVFSDSPHSVGAVDLFALCGDYRKLLTGEIEDLVLPFAPKIWANDYGWAAQKYAFVASRDKKWILTSTVLTSNLWSFLQNAVHADDNILKVSMRMQNGAALAEVVSPKLGDRPAGDAIEIASAQQLQGTRADMAVLRFVVPSSCPTCCECVTKGVLKDANDTSYRLEVLVSLAPLQAAQAARLRYATTIAGLVVLVSALLARAIAKRLVKRIEHISSTTSLVLQTGDLSIRAEEGEGQDEITALARGFNTMMRALRENETYRAERASIDAIAKVAAQAAHDIRSPVAALHVVAEQSTELSEDRRLLVHHAVRRISDIANNLLTKHRTYVSGTQPRSEFIAPLVHSVISEQRVVHAKRGIEHGVEITQQAQQAFCAIEPRMFHGMLSNLLNNAAEAMEDAGTVSLRVSRDAEALMLQIVDEGCGMTPAFIERALQGGVTSKAHGNGMGLSGAAHTVTAWGGKLAVESKPEVGTTITIRLPLARPQAWYAPHIKLVPGKAVFVLDDVDAMGRVWQERLGALGFEVHTFVRADKFIAAVSAQRDACGVALVDYDLLGDKRNGLEVITELDIADRSILVTSYYDEDIVRRTCLDMGICIVPKTLAATVPLHIDTDAAAQGKRSAS